MATTLPKSPLLALNVFFSCGLRFFTHVVCLVETTIFRKLEKKRIIYEVVFSLLGLTCNNTVLKTAPCWTQLPLLLQSPRLVVTLYVKLHDFVQSFAAEVLLESPYRTRAIALSFISNKNNTNLIS